MTRGAKRFAKLRPCALIVQGLGVWLNLGVVGSAYAQPAPPPGFSVHDYSVLMQQGKDGSARAVQRELEGAEQRARIPTSFGVVDLRWNRSVESLFGRSPQRAVQDAWTAAARALAQNSFPAELRSAQYDWHVLIMDRVPAGLDIAGGSGTCHPAWMRPPAEIFVAAKRVATRCGRTSLSPEEAAKELGQSLVHELGHAVEFVFMGKGFARGQRWHAEGFARWFETLAGEYFIGRGRQVTRPEMLKLARAVYQPSWQPHYFSGSAEDYARAYALVGAIASNRSISRLSDIYRRMDRDRITFEQAVERELGWSRDAWAKETERFLKR